MSSAKVEPVSCTRIVDEKLGLVGFVVTDTLIDGRAMGGIRIMKGVTLQTVQALARKMTLKLALANLPIGGAKGGISLDLPPGEDRDRVLRRFGELAGPGIRGGVYLGSDLGCSYKDRDLMFQSAKFTVRQEERRGRRSGNNLPCSWGDFWARCANATGHGVAEAGWVVLEQSGLKPAERTVTVQGFGIVGQGVARRLSERGCKVVAVADRQGTVYRQSGLPVEQLTAITDPTGIIDRGRLPPGVEHLGHEEAWLEVDSQILVLAATGNVIHERNAAKVRAKVILEGANFPVTPDAQRLLAERRVAIVPDIVANTGGAAVTAFILCGLNPPGLSADGLVSWVFDELTRCVRRNIQDVFNEAVRAKVPMPVVAERLAQEKAARYFGCSTEQI